MVGRVPRLELQQNRKEVEELEEEVRYPYISSCIPLIVFSATAPKPEKTAEASFTCETSAGKTVTMAGTIAG